MPNPDLSLRIAQLAGDADRRSSVAFERAGEALALARSVQAALANTGKLLDQVVRPTLTNLNAAERDHLRTVARLEAGQQALAELVGELIERLDPEARGLPAGAARAAAIERVLAARQAADQAVLAELEQLEHEAGRMPTPDLAAGKLGRPDDDPAN